MNRDRPGMSLSARLVLVSFVSLSLHLCGGEMDPDFRKLVPVPLFAATSEGARAYRMPTQGFDLPRETDRLRPGDSLTALITLFEKGGRKSQWLLHVEAAEPTGEEKARTNKPPRVLYVGAGDKVEFSRAMAPVNLRLLGPFTERSAKLWSPKAKEEKARVSVNEGFLSIGLDQAAAAVYRMRQEHFRGTFRVRSRPFTETEAAEGKKAIADLHLSMAEQRALVGANMALESFTRLVQETPGLDGLFFKVVKPPSIWSLVWNLGVKINLDLEGKFVAPTGPIPWNLGPGTPCYTYPLALRVNGKPALTTTLVAAPPRPPLLGCAGVVGMLAENPTDKETFLLFQIISAHQRNESDH